MRDLLLFNKPYSRTLRGFAVTSRHGSGHTCAWSLRDGLAAQPIQPIRGCTDEPMSPENAPVNESQAWANNDSCYIGAFDLHYLANGQPAATG